MDKHTICLLNDSFPPLVDGVANAVVNYAENIKKLGGSPIVAVPKVPGAEPDDFGYTVYRYPSLDTRRAIDYVSGYPFSPGLLELLQNERAALLHTHCPMASLLLARSLREKLDVPLVFTYHTKFDIDIANAIKGRLLQDGFIRAMVQNISACDEVWTVSRGAGENLRSLGYEGSYTVMPNGVDLPRGRLTRGETAAVTAQYDLPDGVPVFLFVGRIRWYKGLRIILDALKLLASGGSDFRMVFIGSGSDMDDVTAYADALGIGARCIFPGIVSERESLRAWYSRADLFLFPSTFDTNGLVVREAAACSTASVLIAGSCAAEDVTDGQNGFLIEENAEAMAACLRRLVREADTVRRTGEAAARELYVSWEDAVGRAAEQYEVILDNYHRGAYARRRRPLDDVFRSQGELMEAIANLDRERRELRAGLDIAREEISAEFGAAREGLAEHSRELRATIDEVKASIIETIDRYL